MVGGGDVLVDSGFMAIEWIVTRPKVQENSGIVGENP